MVTTYEKVRRKARAVDIVIGLALTFLIALFFFLPGSLGEVGQEKLYDFALGFRASPGVSRNIVILAIDDTSVARIGRWPWPRKRIAELINFLSSAGARLVAMDLFFPMAEGEREAGNDRLLGEATRRAGNIVYPFYFGFGRSSGEKGKDEIPPQIADAALLLFDDPKKFSDFPPPLAQELFVPIPEVASGARALGHINVLPDLDGKVRREPLLIAYAGYYFPSFPLQVAASAMRLSRAGITVNVGRSLRLGNRTIPTSQEGMMLIPYDGGSKNFSSYSVADVLIGKIPRDKFSDKIVFVGVTASGLSSGVQDFMISPLANKFPGVEKQALVAAAILEGRFIARPSWASFLEFGLVLILGIVLTYCLPRLGGFFPLVVSLGIVLGLSTLLVGSLHYGFWLPLFFPVLLVILFFFTTIILRAFSTPILPVPEGESTRIMPGEKVASFIEEKTLRLPATDPSSAKKLGRYEILQEIGHGGMGLVYKGRDPIIDRLVAIKTIRFDRLYEGQEIRILKERFFKEAQAAGKLIHPNIVTVFDVGEDGGEAYIAMEFVEGETLAPYIDPNHLLPVKEVLEALSTVALALDFAHQHGIVHRDVKPSNIMRTQKGQIKVMDFGIAKLPSSTLTHTGSILGTPSYMSPEQIHNRPVDGRSDLFSLGCVLYELLTGKKPFRGENFSALVFQIMEADPVSPSQENQRVPSPCDALFTQALAKNPEGRYQDGKEMAEALRKIVHSL